MKTDWIVWSDFSKSILEVGTEEFCKDEARTLNHVYQTNDYVAKPYIPH